MSRFYEAMVRSTEKVSVGVAPTDHPCEELEQAIESTGNPNEELENPIPGVVDWPDIATHESEMSNEPMATATFEPVLERDPSELGIPEDVLHPAYERIIQKLVTFRRSPRQGVILIAGSVAGEGTSTVARNTALALGRGRSEHVVLVDANTRNPSQHGAFRAGLSDGLTDVLRGSISLTSAVNAEVAPGLSLLTAGRPYDSPPRLLTMSSLQGVMMALTSLFDWVVIDAPPLTQYPEAASLAGACGGALLVIRAERTRLEVAEEAKRVLFDSGIEVLGAVLNRRKFHIPGFIYRRL